MAVDVISTLETIVTQQTEMFLMMQTFKEEHRGKKKKKKKTFNNETNRVKKFEFTIIYISKSLEFWKKLLFPA